jgi:hypothetical protein
MSVEIAKYKHYLFVLIALLVTNYLLVPLDEWQAEQKLHLQLVAKQHNKTQLLLNNEEQLSKKLIDSQRSLSKVDQVVFVNSNEDKFKLMVQSSIEKILADGQCKVERFGFKGVTEISAKLKRWLIDVRFKGDIVCMATVTRGVESLPSAVNIVSYNFSHRRLTEEVTGDLSASIQLNVWYKEIK